MLIDAIERHGHPDLDAVIKTKVLQVSAATIDRVLGDVRSRGDGRRKRRTGAGAAIFTAKVPGIESGLDRNQIRPYVPFTGSLDSGPPAIDANHLLSH